MTEPWWFDDLGFLIILGSGKGSSQYSSPRQCSSMVTFLGTIVDAILVDDSVGIELVLLVLVLAVVVGGRRGVLLVS